MRNRLLGERLAALALAPWLRFMRRRIARAGLRHNDSLLGLRSSGHLDEACLLDLLGRLPVPGLGFVGQYGLERAVEDGCRGAFVAPFTHTRGGVSSQARSSRHCRDSAETSG